MNNITTIRRITIEYINAYEIKHTNDIIKLYDTAGVVNGELIAYLNDSFIEIKGGAVSCNYCADTITFNRGKYYTNIYILKNNDIIGTITLENNCGISLYARIKKFYVEIEEFKEIE